MVIDSETFQYKFVKRNYIPLFSQLIERSHYHRQSKSLFKLTNLIRQLILLHLDIHLQQWHLMDYLPVPTCGYTCADQFTAKFRITHNSLYCYCATKKLSFYGFRRHLMMPMPCVVTHFVLTPENYHTVSVTPELLESNRPSIVVGIDKDYLGLPKQLSPPINYQLIVQRKSNQTPNTLFQKSYWECFRKLIQTTNAKLSEQFKMQHSRAKFAWKLMSRIINKMTAHTLAIYLNSLANRPLLAIKSITF